MQRVTLGRGEPSNPSRRGGGGPRRGRVGGARYREVRRASCQVKPQVLCDGRLGAEHGRGDTEHERGDNERDGNRCHHRPHPLEPLWLHLFLVLSVMGKPTEGPRFRSLLSLAGLTRWLAGPRRRIRGPAFRPDLQQRDRNVPSPAVLRISWRRSSASGRHHRSQPGSCPGSRCRSSKSWPYRKRGPRAEGQC